MKYIFLELERITRIRITQVHSYFIASRLMRYRYYIIAILSLLLVVEVVPPFIWSAALVDVVPSFVWDPLPVDPVVYTLLWIGIVGITLLAWIGMASLIVMERTIHYFSVHIVYYVFVVFPLLIVAEFGLFSIAQAFETSQSMSDFLLVAVGIFLIPSLGIIGMVTVILLRTIFANKPRTFAQYVIAILAAVMISAALGIALVVGLWILREEGGALEQFSYVSTSILLLLMPVLSPIGVTVLISMIKRPHQHLLVGGLVLWVTITVGGWGWLGVMNNGLDRFAGAERSAASSALSNAYSFCDAPFSLTRYRVIGGGSGNPYVVRGYTWWRIPIDGPC